MRLGAWLVVTSVLWLVLLLLAWSQEGPREPGGAGPLALASVAAVIDIALLGNIGRWWLRPRWPGRPREGQFSRLSDPLGWPLRAATLVVLVGNLLLTMADRMIPLDWLSLLLCVVGVVLLAGVVRTSPAEDPQDPAAP